ncbi:MAG: M56 family metallopeptidase [Prevotella sp.]|nr:M56 family metallopeptidase [Prevotella sp.]
MMIYLLKVNILLAVFYGFYRLLFVRDTFFGWRRATLLLLMAAAILLPAADFSWWVASHEQTANLAEVYREVLLPTVTVMGNGERFPWLRLFTLLYLSGAALLLMRMVWQLIEILRIRMKSERLSEEGSLFRLTDDTCPFSFFNWIFVNPSAQSDEQLSEVLIHESAHVEQRHSLDIIFTELLTIVCWPNPFMWLLRREVRLNLEYLADARVMAAGSERKAYQYHLLGLAYGKNVATVCNNFNVLPLKLRIRMMNKQRTNKWLRAKYLLVAPIVLLSLVACNLGSGPKDAVEAEAQESPDTMSVVVGKGLPGVDSAQVSNDPEGTFDVVEKMPEFPGGMSELMNYLMKNVKYPKEAIDKGIEGRVIIQFVVAKDGSVINPRVVKSVSPELDAEALRVVKSMPNWKPGMQNDKPVNVKYTIPVSFRLQ